jgi:iron complex transport system permease protein
VRNPLADPYLLGLSGGAGLAAVGAIAVGASSPWAVPAAAWGGALAAVALVYRLAVVAGRRLDPRILLLAGVVVSAFTGAVMSALLTLVPAPQLRNAFLWLLGGFSAASWQALGVFTAYGLAPAALLAFRARRLDLLALGEEPAQYLGLDLERTKREVYFAGSLLTAAAVAVCGVIGFVGLVVPHAMRRLVGPLHGNLIPAVCLTSGGFLVLADALARSVVRPLELPVGVVTAAIGVPLFALLLRRSLR